MHEASQRQLSFAAALLDALPRAAVLLDRPEERERLVQESLTHAPVRKDADDEHHGHRPGDDGLYGHLWLIEDVTRQREAEEGLYEQVRKLAEVLLAAWPLALALGIASVVPFLLWGPVYRRDFTPDRSRLTGLLWGLALWLYAYHLFIVSARGFVRPLRGRTGWAKTRRNAETAGAGPVAAEA